MKNLAVLIVVLFIGTFAFAGENPSYKTYEIEPFTFNPELGYLRMSEKENYLIGKVSIFGNFEDSDFMLGSNLVYGKNVLGDFSMDSASNRIHFGVLAGYRQTRAANANPYTPKFVVGIYGSGNASGTDKRIENVGFTADIVYPVDNFTVFFKYSVESRDLGNTKKSVSSFYAGTRMSLLWKPKMFLDVALTGETQGTSDLFDGMGSFKEDSAKFHLNLESSFSYTFTSTWKVRANGKLGVTPSIASSFEGGIGVEDWKSGFNAKLVYTRNGDMSFNQNALRLRVGIIIH